MQAELSDPKHEVFVLRVCATSPSKFFGPRKEFRSELIQHSFNAGALIYSIISTQELVRELALKVARPRPPPPPPAEQPPAEQAAPPLANQPADQPPADQPRPDRSSREAQIFGAAYSAIERECNLWDFQKEDVQVAFAEKQARARARARAHAHANTH